MGPAQSVHAQFSLGIKGGLSIPNLTAGGNNPVSTGWSSRLGPYFGLIGEYSLSDRFDLQLQLNYSSQGGKKNGEQAIPNPVGSVPPYLYANFNSEVKLNYLELPVLARFKLPMGNDWAFYLFAGPYISYLLNAVNQNSGSSYIYLDQGETMQSPYPPTPQSFDSTLTITDQLERFNAGAAGGIGLQRKIGNGTVFFEAGGNYGFINIQKYPQDGQNHTGSATLTFGYLMKL
jgi:hypothetical protein